MSGENTITIVSKDGDFAAVVAEHARRELDVMVEVASALDALPENTALVVTSETLGAGRVPVLSVAGRAPMKLWNVLREIEEALHGDNSDKILNLSREFSFSPLAKEIVHHPSGKSVALTDKEAQLLLGLAQSESVSRDELLKAVWGMEPDINTHTLETHIYRLRAKFKELGDEQAIAATDNGYRLAV